MISAKHFITFYQTLDSVLETKSIEYPTAPTKDHWYSLQAEFANNDFFNLHANANKAQPRYTLDMHFSDIREPKDFDALFQKEDNLGFWNIGLFPFTTVRESFVYVNRATLKEATEQDVLRYTEKIFRAYLRPEQGLVSDTPINT